MEEVENEAGCLGCIVYAIVVVAALGIFFRIVEWAF